MRRTSRVVGHRRVGLSVRIACGCQATASTIVAPDTAASSETFTSRFGFDFSIENTINQHGLSVGYTSGVTDFESYLASHITTAHDNEWFSNDNINRHIPGLTVTYGFSELTSINGFVLWNEESAGIGTAECSGPRMALITRPSAQSIRHPRQFLRLTRLAPIWRKFSPSPLPRCCPFGF